MSENSKTNESPIKPLGDKVIVRPLAVEEFGAKGFNWTFISLTIF